MTPRPVTISPRTRALCIAAALLAQTVVAARQPWAAAALLPVLTFAVSRAVAQTDDDDARDAEDASNAPPHATSAPGLERSVAEHAPGLPILADQLRATAVQVEDSIVSVCGSFQGMASRARAVVDDLQQRIGDDGGDGTTPGMAELIRGARSRLDTALLRVISDSAASGTVLARVGDAAERIAQVGRAAEQVEGIAAKTKLLALNARIEAVHAGAHGVGFTVVAGEVKQLAEQASATSQEVRALVESITATFAEVHAGVEKLASDTSSTAEQTRHEVETAMTDLERTHEGLQEAVGHALDGSRRLAGEISAAIVGLQFQDAVSQRLQHVVEALMQTEQALLAHLPAGTGTVESAWLEELQRSYTMTAEREILARHLDDAASPDHGSAAGSVELF